MATRSALCTQVSIPKRVSAKVERERFDALTEDADDDDEVSIPKRVSAKVELSKQCPDTRVCRFQSLKGFQPKWNANSCNISTT